MKKVRILLKKVRIFVMICLPIFVVVYNQLMRLVDGKTIFISQILCILLIILFASGVFQLIYGLYKKNLSYKKKIIEKIEFIIKLIVAIVLIIFPSFMLIMRSRVTPPYTFYVYLFFGICFVTGIYRMIILFKRLHTKKSENINDDH